MSIDHVDILFAEVVNFLDKSYLVHHLLKLMERIIQRFPRTNIAEKCMLTLTV